MKRQQVAVMIDLAIRNCGMVSSVGLSTPSACAAIRCGLTNFTETRFIDGNGQWITAAQVPLEKAWRGIAKLAHMAAMAVQEAVRGLDEDAVKETLLLLCLAEADRSGRIAEQDERLLHQVRAISGIGFHPRSQVLANGRVGGVQAVEMARAALSAGKCHYCVVAGVDSYLNAATLSAFQQEIRILTETNSDGFIPGEAAAAVLMAPARKAGPAGVAITGYGFGLEKSHIGSGEPLRGDGMVQAISGALSMAGRDFSDLDFRICDVSGEQYYFKEAALSLTRLMRKRREQFDIWHPAECIGETGAAIVPVVLAVAAAAANKGYLKGPGILCHFANDDGQRAAIVLNATPKDRIR